MFDLLKYQKFWLVMGSIVILFGIASVSIFGLNLGIDFKGGSIEELQFNQAYDTATVENALSQIGVGNFQLQSTENNGLIIKTEALTHGQHTAILEALKENVGDFEEKRFDSIGPIIGEELKGKAIYQLILVCLGIVLYLAYAFRKVSKPITSWNFGIAAVIALFHDLLFVLGIFALLGRFKGVEIDSMFVTAMLTVLGFSVHDTIVVFDRSRENLRRMGGQNIEYIFRKSVAQTVVRSLNTSLTVIFVLLSLLLFGGESIKHFVLALLLGVAVGTYSSIFVASPILLFWHKLKAKKA